MSGDQHPESRQLNMAEALVIFFFLVLIGVVAYFDLVSGTLAKNVQGFPTAFAFVFAYLCMKFLMKATRGHQEYDD